MLAWVLNLGFAASEVVVTPFRAVVVSKSVWIAGAESQQRWVAGTERSHQWSAGAESQRVSTL